jgi:sodium-dependent dicarboxylate transporter 2/3/5
VGSSPKRVLLGLMIVTAFLSMWMSNTATTAIMIPIALVILKKNNLPPLKSNFGRATVLGIAYAANIGGIGTLVGTTPNMIAVKFLADHGVHLNFVDWMVLAIPLVIILLPIAWFALSRMYKSELEKIKVEKFKLTLGGTQKKVLGIFALTVLLWLSTPLHGVASSTIALVPIIMLYALSLLESQDIKTIDWPTLLLVGAGLSLGSAIEFTHLDAVGAHFLQNLVANQPLFLILLAVALFSIILTAFASNTGTAAIVVPVMIPLALFLNVDIKLLAVAAAMATSLDFLLPVGTPPNAIAYSSGYIKVRDMIKAGFFIAILASVILSLLALFW